MLSRNVLGRLATLREADLFAEDLEAHRSLLTSSIENKRVLVVGGAGSIGQATIEVLSRFSPAALHVVDHNENGLAELVRNLRGRPEGLAVSDFRTLPIEFGSPIMQRFLSAQPAYDAVLSFAAVKHVRSEKDLFSVLQMLRVNVRNVDRLMDWCGQPETFFSVSTDKAANPVNVMGASKRFMEHVMFARPGGQRRTARFANVAFSDGSLLHGFLARLERQQPLPVPRGTRRFFVTLAESGQLCTLAAFAGPDRHAVVPRLLPEQDLHLLDRVAVSLVESLGREPVLYENEAEARSKAPEDYRQGRVPILLTELDTTGEKPYEEFCGTGEQLVECGMRALQAVPYLAGPDVASRVRQLEQWTESCQPAELNLEEVLALLAEAVPEFSHSASALHLDQRL